MKLKMCLLFLIFLIPTAASGIDYEIDNVFGDYLVTGVKQRISMDLEGVRLIDVLKVLSQQSGLNFVSTEAVRDRLLTFYVEDVPLKTAMDIIFKANGLSYDYFPEAKIFIVKEIGKPTLELKTKIYRLKYARLNTSNIQKAISSIMSDDEGEGGSDADSESSITLAVTQVLTENGKVAEDPATNSLIVVDVPANFPIIDEVVQGLDIRQPKVLIEVEVLDVLKEKLDQLGVEWPAEVAMLDVSGWKATKFPFSGKFPNDINNWVWEEDTTTATGLVAGGFNINHFTPSILKVLDNTLTLRLLKEDDTTKSLARPKILTLSNEPAQVNLTKNEAIGVSQEETETGQTNTKIERETTGVKLRVTPQVLVGMKEVVMAVEVFTKTAIDSGLKLETFVSGNVKDPEERAARSIMRLRDGQTLLIGGLIKKEEVRNRDRVPFFSDIPFLGAMFRNKRDDIDSRELLVFITPHIVEDDIEGPVVTGNTLEHREQSAPSKQDAVDSALDQYAVVQRQKGK